MPWFSGLVIVFSVPCVPETAFCGSLCQGIRPSGSDAVVRIAWRRLWRLRGRERHLAVWVPGLTCSPRPSGLSPACTSLSPWASFLSLSGLPSPRHLSAGTLFGLPLFCEASCHIPYPFSVFICCGQGTSKMAFVCVFMLLVLRWFLRDGLGSSLFWHLKSEISC